MIRIKRSTTTTRHAFVCFVHQSYYPQHRCTSSMSGEVQPASILVDSIYLQKCRPIHVNQQISCPLHPQQRLAYNKRLYVPCRAGRYSSLPWTSYRLSALWVHVHREWLSTATEIKSCHRAKSSYHCSCNSLQHLQELRQSTAIYICRPRKNSPGGNLTHRANPPPPTPVLS